MCIYQYLNLFEKPQTSYWSRNCTTRARYESFLNVLIKSCSYTYLSFFFSFLGKVWTVGPTLLWHNSSSSLATWANPKGFLFMHIEVHMFVSLNKHISNISKIKNAIIINLCALNTHTFSFAQPKAKLYISRNFSERSKEEKMISAMKHNSTMTFTKC